MMTSNRRRNWFAALFCVCLLACASEAVLAQQAAPPGPGDFSFGVWTGFAATKTACENCAGDGDYGEAFEIGLSPLWRINSKTVAGLELVIQPTSKIDDVRTSWLLGTLQFQPWKTQGFFLKGGYGLFWVRTTLEIEGQEKGGKFRGIVVNYGLGWEFRKNRRVSFAPFGAHYVATVGTVMVDEFEAVNVVGNSWVGGLQVFIK